MIPIRPGWLKRWAARKESRRPIVRSGRAVAQQAAWMGSGFAIVFDDRLTVDQDCTEPLGFAHAAPFAARKVPRYLHRFHPQVLEVVHDDICRGAFAQETAVAETGAKGGQGAEPPMGFLKLEHPALAYQPLEHLGRILTAGEELGMGAAVGDSGNEPRIVEHLLHEIH